MHENVRDTAQDIARLDLIAQRLKGQFSPAYLTLTSIIQGVALATLATRVEATLPNFDLVAWLLTIIAFLVILDIWHEYLMMVLAYVWLPTLLDSLVPFAFVAAELFLVHFIYGGLRGWLLSYAACYAVGGLSWMQRDLQTRRLADENQRTKGILARHDLLRGVCAIVIAALSILAWALYDVLHLDQARLLVALIALVGVIAFLLSSVPGWQHLLSVVQAEQDAQA